ncbi:MAG: InlB B-repeat-containing protein, partial [Lachnospiraceae bacterium]|nr:InlB B-repeat-containing protein [Lachnospiraceae bacterium]
MKRILSIFFAVFLSLSMLAQEVPVYASQPDIQSGDISLEETDENGISEEPVEEVLEEPVEEAAEEVVEAADEAYMSSELLGEDPDPAPEPEYYHVDFYANNGTSTKLTQDIQVGLDTPLTLNRFTKTGYTFREWNDRSTGDGNAYYDGEQVRDLAASGATVNLYAQWDPNPYTVRFDANGGSCATTSMTVRYNVPYGPLPEPVRSHYDFLGWYTAVSGGSKVTEDDKYMNLMDKTLYAQWKGVEVEVDFDANLEGATLSAPSKIVNYDDYYGKLASASKTGYRFLGWYTAPEDGTRVIDSDKVTRLSTHTLYAHWSIITRTVTFKPNGGSCDTESKIVVYGGKYGDLPEPTNTGYTFNGWYTQLVGGEKITANTDVTITADQILYAQWSGVNKTVTLDPVDGTVSPETVTVTYAGKYMLPTPEKEGNSFLGWFTEETGGTQVRTGDEARLLTDITLYAHWKAGTYYAFYNPNGGELKEQGKNVTYGQPYGTLPEPKREGYYFGGWYTGGNHVEPDTIVSTPSSHTLVAHWNSKTPTIYFDGNGGTVPAGEESKTVTYAEPYGELPEATRQCYDLTGWFTEAEGGEEITADSIVDVASAQTLYAHWTGKEYTISINGNGGTCFPVTKKVYYDATYGTLPTASRTGHHFTGWFTEAEGGEEVKADTVVSTDNLDPEASEHKLFAHWEAAEYTVSFRPNGGTVPVGKESKTVTFGQPYGELPEPTRTGNNFGGWYLGNPETGTLVEATTTVATGADHDLTAKWLGRPYTVTFDVNGGDELPEEERTKTVYYKENYGSLPVPSREGFDFKGWYTGSEGGNQINPTTKVSVDADHAIYAKWSAIRCKVDFYANGGNWNGSPTRKLDTDWNTKFDTDRLIAPKYKKHAFTDWYKDPECTELFDFDQVIKENVEIYAGWEELHLSGFDIKGLEGPFYYTGKAIKPAVTVYDYDHDYDIPLVAGKDYTLSFKN